jgi:hypothetical protein
MKAITLALGFGILGSLLWIGWSLREIANKAGYVEAHANGSIYVENMPKN